MHHLRAAGVGAIFGALLGCLAYLVDLPPKALSLGGWVLALMAFVVLGGISGWYRGQD